MRSGDKQVCTGLGLSWRFMAVVYHVELQGKVLFGIAGMCQRFCDAYDLIMGSAKGMRPKHQTTLSSASSASSSSSSSSFSIFAALKAAMLRDGKAMQAYKSWRR